VSVLTQTLPEPPPGAGAVFVSDVFLLSAAVLVSAVLFVSAAGVVVRDLAGTSDFAPPSRCKNEGLDVALGDAAAAAGEPARLAVVALSVPVERFALALVEAVAAGEAAGVPVLLVERFFASAGDAAGLSEPDGEASALVDRLCFAAGDALALSVGDGLCAKPEKTVNVRRTARQTSFFMRPAC
jgi:hypothetical protein